VEHEETERIQISPHKLQMAESVNRVPSRAHQLITRVAVEDPRVEVLLRQRTFTTPRAQVLEVMAAAVLAAQCQDLSAETEPISLAGVEVREVFLAPLLIQN
jgi:hypothetical protein